MKYSINKGINKSIKYAIIFIIPVLVDKFVYAMPEYANITIGGILVGVVNYLKIKYDFKV